MWSAIYSQTHITYVLAVVIDCTRYNIKTIERLDLSNFFFIYFDAQPLLVNHYRHLVCRDQMGYRYQTSLSNSRTIY